MIRSLNDVPIVYWKEEVKISFLQRTILVNSRLYYDRNITVMSDREYDSISKQLVVMQKKVSKEILKKTDYYDAFKDFDGTTGFDLYDRLSTNEKHMINIIVESIVNQKVRGKEL